MPTVQGHKIRTTRRILGMTQRRLAELCKCQQPWISRIEGGYVTPDNQFVHKAAEVLGVHLDNGKRRS